MFNLEQLYIFFIINIFILIFININVINMLMFINISNDFYIFTN